MKCSLLFAIVLFAFANGSYWSDSSSWPNGVPSTSSDVVISSQITVDVNVDVKSITITSTGVLNFKNLVNINISTNYILVETGGLFEWGTESQPYSAKGILTLRGSPTDADVEGMGSKFLAAYGGTVSLHGKIRTNYAFLVKNALPGQTTITLDRCVDWVAGDQIALLSSDFEFLQSENLTVISTDGCGVVTFSSPLQYKHQGQTNTVNGYLFDERAEVLLLTQHIVVQGDESSESTRYGAQVRANPSGSSMGSLQISGVEFYRVGQGLDANGNGLLGRYPFHMHMIEEGGANCYLKYSSIHRTFSRCTTIHNTHYATIYHNVMYDYTGHCVFMEDGPEFGNNVSSNIVAGGRQSPKPLIPSEGDSSEAGSKFASFWIVNPNNTYQFNRAAGATGGFGFWYQIQPVITGLSVGLTRYANTNPQEAPMPIRGFYGNVAHSYSKTYQSEFPCSTGLFLQNMNGLGYHHMLVENSFFYKISGAGIWNNMDSSTVKMSDCYFADNYMGVFQGGIVENSVFIKETLNEYDPIIGANGYAADSVGILGNDHRPAVMHYDGHFFLDSNVFIDFNVAKNVSKVGTRTRGISFAPRIMHDAGLDNYLKDNIFIRSVPAGFGQTSSPVSISAVTLLGNNKDENGNSLGNGYLTSNYSILITPSCICKHIADNGDFNSCWCQTNSTAAGMNMGADFAPAYQNPVKTLADFLTDQPLIGGTITNDLGTQVDGAFWIAPNGGYSSNQILPTERGYFIELVNKGWELPELHFGFGAFRSSWIKFAIYYPYQGFQLWNGTTWNPTTSTAVTSTELFSKADLNGKTDLGFYHYHDNETGILYVHVDAYYVTIIISRSVTPDRDLVYGSNPPNTITLVNPPTRYTPAVSGGAEPHAYDSLIAISPVQTQKPTTTFDFGDGGVDLTKYVAADGVTQHGSPVDPGTPSTQTTDSLDPTHTDEVSNANRRCVVAFTVVILSAFVILF